MNQMSKPDEDVSAHERRPIQRGATFNSSKYAVAGVDSNYDVDMSADIPYRSRKTLPPVDFGHPRGLAEDPVRDGCYSNFGKGGVRHYRKRMVDGAAAAAHNNLKHCDGGLAPTSGPVRFGHQCTGLGVKSPEGPNQRRVPYLAQRTENFIECGPLPPEEVKTRKHAQYKSEAPYANHFKDTEYSVTTHNQVFGIGGERRHLALGNPTERSEGWIRVTVEPVKS